MKGQHLQKKDHKLIKNLNIQSKSNNIYIENFLKRNINLYINLKKVKNFSKKVLQNKLYML